MRVKWKLAKRKPDPAVPGVAAGVVGGGIVETDCASVSIGKGFRVEPYAELLADISIVDTIPLSCAVDGIPEHKTVTESSAIHNGPGIQCLTPRIDCTTKKVLDQTRKVGA
jgi:hypothetical protein